MTSCVIRSLQLSVAFEWTVSFETFLIKLKRLMNCFYLPKLDDHVCLRWKAWNESNLPSKPRCPTCPHVVQSHKRQQKMFATHMPQNGPKKKRSNQTSRWRKKRRKFGRFPSFAKVKLQSLWRHPGMASVPSVPATVFFFLQSNQNRMVPIFFCLNKGVSLHMYVNYSTILSGMEKNSAKTQVSKCVNFLCVFFDMFWNRDENLNGMEKNIPSMFWSKRSWGKNTKDLGAQVGLSVVKRRPPLRRKRRGMKVLFIVFFVGGWRC